MTASLIEYLKRRCADHHWAVNSDDVIEFAEEYVRQHEAEEPEEASEEMVERVAMALAAHAWEYGNADTVQEDVGIFVAENVRQYKGAARAAIAAMGATSDLHATAPRESRAESATRKDAEAEAAPAKPQNADSPFFKLGQALFDVANAPQPAPAPDGWIDWHGGECPVPPDTVVEVAFRDNPEKIEGPVPASDVSELWDGQNDGDDIIRYRIVREGGGGCGCRKCLEGKRDPDTGLPITATRMICCEVCGNKRCPHATDHRLACSGSNEPGQKGSAYE